jgi:hypothetical protein
MTGKKMKRVNSIDRMSNGSSNMTHHFNDFYGIKRAKPKPRLSNIDQQIQTRLAYEWKNIYRQLCLQDKDETFLVKISEFDQTCEKFRTNLSREELKRIKVLC